MKVIKSKLGKKSPQKENIHSNLDNYPKIENLDPEVSEANLQIKKSSRVAAISKRKTLRPYNKYPNQESVSQAGSGINKKTRRNLYQQDELNVIAYDSYNNDRRIGIRSQILNEAIINGKIQILKAGSVDYPTEYLIYGGITLIAVGVIVLFKYKDMQQSISSSDKSIAFTTYMIVGILCIYFISTKLQELKHKELAIQNLNYLLDVTLEDKESDQKLNISEEKLLSLFSSISNMTVNAYISTVYPEVLELIKKSNTLYFEKDNEELFLKIR